MNREAAALGVPVYSTFRGPTGAVDRWLASQGRLVLLESAADVRARLVLAKRDRSRPPPSAGRAALDAIVAHIARVAGPRSVADDGSENGRRMNRTLRLLLVAGARPNFMKVAPIVHRLRQHAAEGREPLMTYRLVHTGQHYDERMSTVFFDELDVRRPDVNLGVGSGVPRGADRRA